MVGILRYGNLATLRRCLSGQPNFALWQELARQMQGHYETITKNIQCKCDQEYCQHTLPLFILSISLPLALERKLHFLLLFTHQ